MKAKAPEKATTQKKESLLDVKKMTSIGIRMSRLKVPWTEVGDAILTLDSKALGNAEDIQMILACLPGDDDKTKLKVWLVLCVHSSLRLSGFVDHQCMYAYIYTWFVCVLGCSCSACCTIADTEDIQTNAACSPVGDDKTQLKVWLVLCK